MTDSPAPESARKAPPPSVTKRLSLLRNQAFDAFFRWLILIGLICFGAAILWDYGYIAYLFDNDSSGISKVILGVFAAFSLYCAYMIFDRSRELGLAELCLAAVANDQPMRTETGDLIINDRTFEVDRPVAEFMHDALVKMSHDSGASLDVLLQSFSAEIRRPGRLGIFVADVVYKLGMLGTVIGFIAMLVSMRDLGQFDVETMRTALQQMTSGMATALLTTVTGLVCGVLLRLQFNILDTLATKLVRRLVRISEIALSHQHTAR